MGARRVADATGRTFRQMLALVGEGTEAGQVVRRESTALVHKSLNELTDADLRVLGFPAGKAGYFSKGARVANVSREQALKDLLHEAEKEGISIDAGEDAAAYLDFRARQMDMPPQDVHAVTIGDAILVRPEHAANVRILREELIHAFQQRAGMASNEVVEGEIQARLLMIRYRHTWAITNDEVREMIREVRIMRRTGKY